MKKSILARGFIGSVASLLGVCAVGCGADSGWEGAAGDSAEIGSISEALTTANVVNQSHAFAKAGPDASVFGSACEIEDPVSGAKYMLALGGIEDVSNTFSDDATLYVPGTGWSAAAVTTFTDARAFAKVITDPSDVSSCLAFGGENGVNTFDQIVKITLSKPSGVLTLTASNAGKLTVARSYVQAVPMPGNKVLIMGGFTSPGQVNQSAVMDVWAGETGTTTIQTFQNQSGNTVTLNVARGDFGADVSTADTSRILIGGGKAGAALPRELEGIDVDANGDLESTTATNPFNITDLSPSDRTKLSGLAGRQGAAVMYESIASGVETWVIGPGSGAATIDKVTIDWSDFTNANNSAPSNACASGSLTAVSRPLNVKQADGRLIMVGGTGTGQNRVQEYHAAGATVCTSVTQDSSSTNLVNREGALGALVNGSVYYSAGRDAATNPDTLHVTTFKVN